MTPKAPTTRVVSASVARAGRRRQAQNTIATIAASASTPVTSGDGTEGGPDVVTAAGWCGQERREAHRPDHLREARADAEGGPLVATEAGDQPDVAAAVDHRVDDHREPRQDRHDDGGHHPRHRAVARRARVVDDVGEAGAPAPTGPVAGRRAVCRRARRGRAGASAIGWRSGRRRRTTHRPMPTPIARIARCAWATKAKKKAASGRRRMSPSRTAHASAARPSRGMPPMFELMMSVRTSGPSDHAMPDTISRAREADPGPGPPEDHPRRGEHRSQREDGGADQRTGVRAERERGDGEQVELDRSGMGRSVVLGVDARPCWAGRSGAGCR